MARLERRIAQLEQQQGQPDKLIEIGEFLVSERDLQAILREGHFESAQDVINPEDCTP